MIIASFSLATGPTGLMAVAALIMGLRAVVRTVVVRGRVIGSYFALVAPVLAAGTMVLISVFGVQSLAAVLEAIRVRGAIGPSLSWYEEFVRYYYLMIPTVDGSLSRRLPVLLVLLCLAVVIGTLLRRGKVPGAASGSAEPCGGTAGRRSDARSSAPLCSALPHLKRIRKTRVPIVTKRRNGERRQKRGRAPHRARLSPARGRRPARTEPERAIPPGRDGAPGARRDTAAGAGRGAERRPELCGTEPGTVPPSAAPLPTLAPGLAALPHLPSPHAARGAAGGARRGPTRPCPPRTEGRRRARAHLSSPRASPRLASSRPAPPRLAEGAARAERVPEKRPHPAPRSLISGRAAAPAARHAEP